MDWASSSAFHPDLLRKNGRIDSSLCFVRRMHPPIVFLMMKMMEWASWRGQWLYSAGTVLPHPSPQTNVLQAAAVAVAVTFLKRSTTMKNGIWLPCFWLMAQLFTKIFHGTTRCNLMNALHKLSPLQQNTLLQYTESLMFRLIWRRKSWSVSLSREPLTGQALISYAWFSWTSITDLIIRERHFDSFEGPFGCQDAAMQSQQYGLLALRGTVQLTLRDADFGITTTASTLRKTPSCWLITGIMCVCRFLGAWTKRWRTSLARSVRPQILTPQQCSKCPFRHLWMILGRLPFEMHKKHVIYDHNEPCRKDKFETVSRNSSWTFLQLFGIDRNYDSVFLDNKKQCSLTHGSLGFRLRTDATSHDL